MNKIIGYFYLFASVTAVPLGAYALHCVHTHDLVGLAFTKLVAGTALFGLLVLAAVSLVQALLHK